MLCVVVLPSFMVMEFSGLLFVVFSSVRCRGEYTGSEYFFTTLVLPSVVLFFIFVFGYVLLLKCRGDSQGRVVIF